MMEYVRQFQNKAGGIVGSHQPNRPALVLYFGDIAMRGRAALREKMLSQIPANYHSAIVEGAFCSPGEAGDVPFMDVSFVAAPMDFGNYAQNWNTPDRLLEVEKFLTTLLQKTTEKPVAVTMAELDVYLVVGNDGGACELWPTILSILSRPGMTVIAVKRHLVWMVRELAAYQQPRDLPMYRLLTLIENRGADEASMASAPEMQAIPFALDAWKNDLSITIVTDRNQTGVCSDDVWKASCEAIAGYMLAHMFSSYALPARCTCAMYDAIYPDLFWSTGFQISAMLKLESELQVREAARMQTFPPMLAQAWNIPSIQSISIIPLLSSVLPTPDDLYMLPVNANVEKSALKACKNMADSVRLLYGDRFEQFFVDALESGSFAQLVEDLTDSLQQTVERFAATNGVYAAAALLNERSDASLPALFQSFCQDLNHQARLDSIVIPGIGFLRNPVEQRQEEVILRGSRDKFEEMNAKAVRLLFGKLGDAMKKWHTQYQQKADALRSAFAAVSDRLSACFSGVMLSYHHTVKQYADNRRLYVPNITDADFELLNSCFTVRNAADSLIETLTQLNLRNNSFITLTMQNAFTQLGYLNGSNELKAALDAFCKAAVFSPVHYDRKEVYILPSEGDWSNGGRVYGLIRLYSTPGDVSLLQSISYLANLAGDAGLSLQAGSALPVQSAAPETAAPVQQHTETFEQPDAEEEKPLGKVQYTKPDSLLTFEWPQAGVELLNMTITSTTGFGERPYQQTITVSSKNYLTRGGAILPNVRLTGRCDVSLSWYEYGTPFEKQGWLTVEPVHISRIVTEKGKDFVVNITASESVPQLERYLMLQIRKGNGACVSYRLPTLVNGAFTISKAHCHGRPEVILSDPKWKEYFSF